MVLGLLVLTAIPSVTGVSQAISAQRNRDQRDKDEQRMKKFNVEVECDRYDVSTADIDGGRLVLKDGNAYIRPSSACTKRDDGFVAEAFYIEYPDNERIPTAIGLVSQVESDPPLLNWIYVDRHTMEVKHGNRSRSIDHHIGSWDWGQDMTTITLEQANGRQTDGFMAVFNKLNNEWQLLFDSDGNALERLVQPDWPRVKVRLRRRLLAGV